MQYKFCVTKTNLGKITQIHNQMKYIYRPDDVIVKLHCLNDNLCRGQTTTKSKEDDDGNCNAAMRVAVLFLCLRCVGCGHCVSTHGGGGALVIREI